MMRMSNLARKSSPFTVCHNAPSVAVTESHTSSEPLETAFFLMLIRICDSCLTLVAGMHFKWSFDLMVTLLCFYCPYNLWLKVRMI